MQEEAAGLPSTSGLWIFGYGSLCWHPGFEFEKSLTGYVRGFSRKFWQGNTTHRGTEAKPGRVATLIEDKDGLVWGRAFEVRGEAALPYLDTRECKLGGYHVQFTTFFPRPFSYFSSSSDSDSNDSSTPTSFPTVFYVATPNNRLWLGDAPVTEIASQIVECSGPSGHNVEYLLRLAGFMHDYVPDIIDEHLFTLEFLVRSRIKEQNLCLKTLMGGSIPASPPRTPPHELEDGEDEGAAGGEPVVRPDSFQYTSRVPPKKLRCLNI